MTFEQYCQRADLLGTQIITRDTGKRLGVVSQIWVDIDRREVVAFGLRESVLSGVLSSTQEIMLLNNIRQIGDVILVDDDNAVEDAFDTDPYSILINSEVITETGELLGKVRGFKFNVNDGKVESLVIASLGIPLIPDQVISTYELSIEEVVSSGPDRLIVFEGAEEKMVQMTVGVLERLGIGRPPWDRDVDDYYVMPTSTSNQLGTGMPVAQPLQTVMPTAQETWDEDNWNEPQERVMPEPLRQAEPEPVYYQEANWGNETYEQQVAYVDEDYAAPPGAAPEPYPEAQYEDVEVTGDAWADEDSPKPYTPPKLNLPDRQKVAEYEEEIDY
ncbi:MAG TPA: PRC-barrel domain-containing protein [Candidatus Obscuribacterales bacterium]